MIPLLMTLLAQLPPDQPGYVRARPRVVIITMRGCDPCKELVGDPEKGTTGTLQPLMVDPSVDVYVEDMFSWNKRTAEGFHVHTVPTVYAWHNPSEPGRRFIYPASTIGRIRDALRPPKRSTAMGWLSVNGVPAEAHHKVTITGDVWLVAPNTEQAWRRHIAEDHGVSAAWNMTPKQLAEAHRDAHRAQ